jgi:hypothetical protein
MTFSQGTAIGSNCLLYASTGVTFNQGSVVIENSALLTPGTIVAKEAFSFRGLLYTGSGLELKNGGNVTGVIVSGGVDMNTEATLKNDVHVTYDFSALPSQSPPGLGGVALVRSNWREE